MRGQAETEAGAPEHQAAPVPPAEFSGRIPTHISPCPPHRSGWGHATPHWVTGCLGSGQPQDPRRGGEGRGRQVAGDPPRGCSASEARAQACLLSVGCAPMDQGGSCRRDGPHTRAPAPAASPHLEDDSHDGQVQGVPRHGRRPLVNLVADCGHRRPASEAGPGASCPAELPGTAAGQTQRPHCTCWPLTCFQAGHQLVEELRGHQAQQCLEQPDEGQAGQQHQRLQGPGAGETSPQPPRTWQGSPGPALQGCPGRASHRLSRTAVPGTAQ